MKKELLEKLDRMNRTITIYDVMSHTGKSRQTIYNWMDKGLPHSKTDLGELRFSMTEVEKFLSNGMNERQLIEPKNRKAVKIDEKLFQKLIDKAPGKHIIKVVDNVVETGMKDCESGVKLKPFGSGDKLIRIEKELYKKLLFMSVDIEVPVYKITNSIISIGLKNF